MAKPAFPPPEQIYSLGDRLTNRVMRGKYCGDKWWEVSTGDYRPRQPVEVRWAMGGAEPSDFIWTTAGYPLIVHERIVEILLQNGFKGWRTYKVAVHNKKSKFIKGYHGLAITGRCGYKDLSASQAEIVEYPGGSSPQFRGCYYRPGAWAGESLFLPGPRPGKTGVSSLTRLATEPVIAALRKAKAKASNIEMERTTEKTFPPYLYYDKAHIDWLPKNHWQLIEAAYKAIDKPMSDYARKLKAEFLALQRELKHK